MRTRSLVLSGALLGAAVFSSTAAQAQTCRDPWITQAIREVTGRAPNGNYESGECTYTQYANGRWNNYAELKAAVQAKLGRPTIDPRLTSGQNQGFATRSFKATAAQIQAAPRRVVNGQTIYQINGQWWRLIGQDGASYNLIGHDGAT